MPQPPPPVPSSDLKCKTVVVAELSRFLPHFPCFSESTTGKEESCLFLDTHRFCLGQRRVRVSRFVVQSLSLVQPFVTPWTVARQTSLSFTISWSLLRFMSIELVMPCSHLVLCHPLLLLPSIFPSIKVFSNKSALHIRWPKYWNFSFSISPFNKYSGLISFRNDWLDDLAVLHHHSSKASILCHSSLLYGPTLISMHDYWNNSSFDLMNLCWQSDISAF